MAAALRKKEEEDGHLRPVLKAFGKTLIEQVRWKRRSRALTGMKSRRRTRKDSGREFRWRPGAAHSAWVPMAGGGGAHHPSLAEGFPKIGEDLARLRAAVLDGSFSLTFSLRGIRGQG